MGEASERQVNEMNRIINLFCGASDQAIRMAKSSMFFWKNVRPNVVNLSVKLNIPITDNLTSYLGFSILHGRKPCHQYDGILEKIKKKLSS